jgi:hypothetical protein
MQNQSSLQEGKNGSGGPDVTPGKAGLSRLGWGLILLVLPLSLKAADARLASNSPFLSAEGGGAASAGTGSALIELRGIMDSHGETLFAIYDVQRRSSTWVHLHEVGPGFVVQEYKIVAGVDQVVVQFQGVTQRLMLKSSRTGASERGGGPLLTGGQSSQVSNDTPNLPGIPEGELLPRESDRIKLLAAQIQARMDHDKQGDKEPSRSNKLPPIQR